MRFRVNRLRPRAEGALDEQEVMSTTTNMLMRRLRNGSLAGTLVAWIAALALAACGSSGTDPGTDAVPRACDPNATAPTYTELYNRYFAANTPGHCATSECHADPRHESWLCGPTKDVCYNGMVQIGLINTTNPIASRIADPKSSPINWVNPAGPMPADDPRPFPEGRDAIIAWVNACAKNN
jgi:hypothetical protein